MFAGGTAPQHQYRVDLFNEMNSRIAHRDYSSNPTVTWKGDRPARIKVQASTKAFKPGGGVHAYYNSVRLFTVRSP